MGPGTGPLRRLQSSSWWVGLQASQSSTGAGEFTSKRAHLPAWQVSAGCRQEASVPCRVDLSVGLLECPHNSVASFPENEHPKVKAVTFRTNLRVTLCHFAMYCWFHRAALFRTEGTTQGRKYSDARITGDHLEAGNPTRKRAAVCARCLDVGIKGDLGLPWGCSG